MTASDDFEVAITFSGRSIARLATLGGLLLAAGTLLSMFGTDLAHAIAGIGDPLSQVIADLVVTLAQVALGPSGALMITAAILLRGARRRRNAPRHE